tara:strand:+ start:2481 stop:4610 length:2130 start_codon:yes stop_codon:yes gene_type:complete
MNNNLANVLEEASIFDGFYENKTKEQQVTIGQAQWKALHDLEASYDEMPMSEFGDEVKFSDSVWPVNWNGRYIKWNEYLTSTGDNYPFILLIKITVYYRVQTLKFSPRSHYKRINSFVESIGNLLARKNILNANENSPFVPASVITMDTVTELIKSGVREGVIRSAHILQFFSWVIKTPKHCLDKASLLNISCELPWQDTNKKNGLDKEQVYLNDLLGSKTTREAIKSYKPFSSDVCAKIIDFSLPIITEQAELVTHIIKFGRNTENYVKSGSLLKASARDELEKYAEQLESIYPISYTDGTNFEKGRITSRSISKQWFINFFYICQSAALWIILLTTGLRNVDICESLMRKCYIPDDNSDIIFYLITDILKVKKTDYPIPIPPQTVSAIDFLNKINAAPAEVKNLVTRYELNRNAKYWFYNSGDVLNNHMRDLADYLGIDLLDGLKEEDRTEGLAHRGRATMAGWIGTNSPLAILIVKRLFGHTNEIMPDHYLRHNKEVQKYRDEIRKQTYIDLSEDIAVAIVDGKISGGIKKQINEGREYIESQIQKEATEKNMSITGPELRQTLIQQIQQILYTRLNNGEMLGLLTPLAVVCMRNPSSSGDAPCSISANKLARENNEINKQFANELQMSTLPELDNCKGASCQHSLMYDNPMTKLLLDQFKYYCNYLKGLGSTDIDLKSEAKNFIGLYSGPLIEVYPEHAGTIEEQ